MFDFIKRWFKGEEKPVEQKSYEEIPVLEVSAWVDKRINEMHSSIHDSIQARLTALKQLMGELDIAANNLGLAQIKESDENVDARVKNVVMGNRQNYIRLLKNTVLRVPIPSEITLTSTLTFCDEMESTLNDIAAQSTKSYYTVQHLFSENVAEISSILREIDRHVKETREAIAAQKLHNTKDIKSMIAVLSEGYSKKKSIAGQIEKANKLRKDAEELKAKSAERRDTLTNSPDFMQLKREQDILKETDENILRLKRNIVELVSPLDSSLRKYAKVSPEDEKLSQGYAENPVKMMLEDKDLKILDSLQKMKQQLSMGMIEADEKKRAKIIQRIDSIKREDVAKIIGDYNSHVSKKNEIIDKVNSSKLLSERRTLEQQIKSSDRGIEDLTAEIATLEKAQVEIMIDGAAKEIEAKLHEMFKLDVRIVF